MVELNYVDFADYLTRPAESFMAYDHLPHVSQAVIQDPHSDVVRLNGGNGIKLSSVLRRIGMLNTRKTYEKIKKLNLAGYSETLWPFKDKDGRFCFATSHFANMGQQSVTLLRWLAKEADHSKFTLEHYTTPWDMQRNMITWPTMNGGNVHRDHVYIIRSKLD